MQDQPAPTAEGYVSISLTAPEASQRLLRECSTSRMVHVTRLLAIDGIDVNVRDAKGRPALVVAATHGVDAVVTAPIVGVAVDVVSVDTTAAIACLPLSWKACSASLLRSTVSNSAANFASNDSCELCRGRLLVLRSSEPRTSARFRFGAVAHSRSGLTSDCSTSDGPRSAASTRSASSKNSISTERQFLGAQTLEEDSCKRFQFRRKLRKYTPQKTKKKGVHGGLHFKSRALTKLSA